MSLTAAEARLRAVLQHTREDGERPVVDLELPLLMQKAINAGLPYLKPAAVLVPLLRRAGGHSVLLTRRADHLRNHKGQISFPGGRRDADDRSAADCALREAWEEVSLDPQRCEVIGYLDDYPTITRYRVTPVVALVEPPASFAFDANEVAEVFEVPLTVLLDVQRFERKAFSRDGFNVPFFEINHEGRRIWGATAGMLWDLCRKCARG